MTSFEPLTLKARFSQNPSRDRESKSQVKRIFFWRFSAVQHGVLSSGVCRDQDVTARVGGRKGGEVGNALNTKLKDHLCTA